MKVAVCVKHVPDTAARRIDPATKRLDRAGEGALNSFDANAIEEALRIKDAQGEGEIVVVSLGPEKALDSLRKALAMGADRALLVSDADAAGSDLVATSRLLAGALERENADLVLFGQQASDADGAVLWAAVADRLRRPLVSQAAELGLSNGRVRAKRQTEFGYDVIEAPLPAVVAVSGAILKGALGVLTKAASLGDDRVAGFVAGADVGELAADAGRYGAGEVYVADDRRLAQPLPQPRVDVLAELVNAEGFDTVLFGAS